MYPYPLPPYPPIHHIITGWSTDRLDDPPSHRLLGLPPLHPPHARALKRTFDEAPSRGLPLARLFHKLSPKFSTVRRVAPEISERAPPSFTQVIHRLFHRLSRTSPDSLAGFPTPGPGRPFDKRTEGLAGHSTSEPKAWPAIRQANRRPGRRRGNNVTAFSPSCAILLREEGSINHINSTSSKMLPERDT